jgi:phosphoesterase RecJ-like protein
MQIEKEILEIIKRSRRVLLTSHERIDGDGVGSELAVHLALGRLGTPSSVINVGEIPAIYRFLSCADEAKVYPDGWRDDFDLCIALDSGTPDRFEEIYKKIVPLGVQIVNIDHHYSNTRYGSVNWVGDEFSSTGEMIYRFLRGNGLEITSEIAACLYTAIITDTGRFCYSNTHVSTLEAAADLMRCGAVPSDLTHRLYRAERPEVFRLRNLAMSTLQTAAGGKVAMMHVTVDMHRETNTTYLDTQDLVDMPKSIEGVEVGILLREIAEDHKTRVSLRTEGGVDANTIAAEFGGGGHRRAAGCRYDGDIASAREAVVAVVLRHLREAGIHEG